MGIKSSARAAAALAAVKTSGIKQEFALARDMAKQDEAMKNLPKAVERAETKVLEAANKCEQLNEELRKAETDLEIAKEELAQTRSFAEAVAKSQEHTVVDTTSVDA